MHFGIVKKQYPTGFRKPVGSKYLIYTRKNQLLKLQSLCQSTIAERIQRAIPKT